ncbi:hypothetical protein H6775_03845 [Candidatus Nomurabacteria bacterium]|nr:hypothetical protein [Candidatus Nomurabacteria bacterium]
MNQFKNFAYVKEEIPLIEIAELQVNKLKKSSIRHRLICREITEGSLLQGVFYLSKKDALRLIKFDIRNTYLRIDKKDGSFLYVSKYLYQNLIDITIGTGPQEEFIEVHADISLDEYNNLLEFIKTPLYKQLV